MIVDRRDFDFLFHWLDLPGLLTRPRFSTHDVETIGEMLSLAQRISEKELAPYLRASDLHEPELGADGAVTVLPEVARAVRAIAEAGLFAMPFDAEHGGLQLPNLVYMASLGILMSGNLGAASFLLLTAANARLLTIYASPAQVAAFALPQIAGAALGTMCLSEPHAGSSLADIRTQAVPDGHDALGHRFRIAGSKMWISAGDHDVTENIVHLVLAKVPNAEGTVPEGTSGISLFIVPKILPDHQRNDTSVVGLNHKMGYRAIPNTALNFGEGRTAPDGRAGALGWIVGTPGRGLSQMFQMMNEARVSVGLAGAMLACRGYLMSLDYARERRQGRRIGDRGGPPVAIIEHADVRRMLLAQKALSQGALALVLFSARLLDDEKTAASADERAEAASLLALLTPVTKTWPSEWAQLSLHHALQIHGGAGYTLDFEVEQLYRDNRLNPIHEGTTGVQGLDLLGRKIRRDNGQVFEKLAARIRVSVAHAAERSELKDAARSVERALEHVAAGVSALVGQADDERALAHSTEFLFAFGHLIVGWLWLDQARAASALLDGDDGRFQKPHLRGRISACRYFAEAELPKVAAWLEPALANSDLVLAMSAEEF